MKKTLTAIASSVLTLLVFEGLASVWLSIPKQVGEEVVGPLSDGFHTQFDSQLGWVSKRGREFRDLFGRGVHVAINEQGFRDREATTRTVPEGKFRVVCSGDSFTFGHGVSDGETWCDLLALPNRPVQSVNAGQIAYGSGQSYLFYRRHVELIEHQVHVFAFNEVDIDRIRWEIFRGYSKPRLRVQDGGLIAENVPVPDSSPVSSFFRNLRITEVLGISPLDVVHSPLPRREAYAVALRMFEELAAEDAARGRLTWVVYLPWSSETSSDRPHSFGITRLLDELRQRGILVTDLTPVLRAARAEPTPELYIPEGRLSDPTSTGHYSVEGNRVVALVLSQELAKIAASDRFATD